jgi:hypothetical protein
MLSLSTVLPPIAADCFLLLIGIRCLVQSQSCDDCVSAVALNFYFQYELFRAK